MFFGVQFIKIFQMLFNKKYCFKNLSFFFSHPSRKKSWYEPNRGSKIVIRTESWVWCIVTALKHTHTPVGPTRQDTGTRADSWCFSGPPSLNLNTAAPLSHTWPTPDRLYKRFRSLRSHTHTETMRLQVSAHTNTHVSVTDRRAAGYRRWTAEASRESWPDLWFCSCILRRREPNTQTTGSTGPSLLNTETPNITCTVTLQGQASWMEDSDRLFYWPGVVWTIFWIKSETPHNYSLEGVASPCKICLINIQTNTNSYFC